MLVLIIRKPTNLEHHQAMAQKGEVPEHPDPAYLRLITQAHQEHYLCKERLLEQLKICGIQAIEATRGEEWPRGPFDYVISLGGDGTLITASYGIKDATPLIGIRSSSASVGYLCAADIKTLDGLVRKMAGGTIALVERHRLEARVDHEAGGHTLSPYMALNDFLFAASSPAATTRYQLTCDDRTETHKSSGIWIATATGSSAAIGAAGGTLMAADDRRLQFLVRELYRGAGDDLRLRHGFTEPGRERFEIESLCPAAILALDGEKWMCKVSFGDRISFQSAVSVRVARAVEHE